MAALDPAAQSAYEALLTSHARFTLRVQRKGKDNSTLAAYSLCTDDGKPALRVSVHSDKKSDKYFQFTVKVALPDDRIVTLITCEGCAASWGQGGAAREPPPTNVMERVEGIIELQTVTQDLLYQCTCQPCFFPLSVIPKVNL